MVIVKCIFFYCSSSYTHRGLFKHLLCAVKAIGKKMFFFIHLIIGLALCMLQSYPCFFESLFISCRLIDCCATGGTKEKYFLALDNLHSKWVYEMFSPKLDQSFLYLRRKCKHRRINNINIASCNDDRGEKLVLCMSVLFRQFVFLSISIAHFITPYLQFEHISRLSDYVCYQTCCYNVSKPPCIQLIFNNAKCNVKYLCFTMMCNIKLVLCHVM